MAKRRKKRKQQGKAPPKPAQGEPIGEPVEPAPPPSAVVAPGKGADGLAGLAAQLSDPSNARWLLAGVVLFAYALSFWVPFLFDDAPVITRNRLLWDVGSAFDLIRSKPTRALTNLSFLINFQLAHLGTVPQLPYEMRDWWSYHLVSVAAHGLNTILLYELIRGCLRALGERVAVGHAPLVALGAAAVWGLHPANVMAVAYIAQRYALFAGLAFLLSLVLYVRLRLRMQETGQGPLEVWKGYALVLGCVCAALTTKENAALVPLALVLCELCIFGGRQWKATAVFFLPHALGSVLLMGLMGFDGFMARFLPAESPTSTRGEYLVTQVPVTLRYLHLWLFPYDLTIEQAYPILWEDGGWNPRYSGAAGMFFLGLFGHLLIAGLAVKLWLRGHRLIPFAIGWFYATNIVESSFIPILDPMVDHRMYVPTMLLPLACGVALSRGWPALTGWWPGAVRAVPLALGGLCLALVVGTFARTLVWTSATGLWRDTLSKRPNCARAWSSLGMEKLYERDWLGAVQPIETALMLSPTHVEGWNNLGKAYLELRQWRDAERCLLMGIEVNEHHYSSSVRMCWNNVGLVYLEQAQEAQETLARRELLMRASYRFRKAIELYEYYETAYANLAASEYLLLDMAPSSRERTLHAKRILEATTAAQKLSAARGSVLSAHQVRRGAVALAELGGAPQAMEALENLLATDPRIAPLVLEDLAKVALRALANEHEQAAELLERAARTIDRVVQKRGTGHGELAVLRGQVADARGNRERALRYLRAGLKAAPDHPDADAIRRRIEQLESQPDGPSGPQRN